MSMILLHKKENKESNEEKIQKADFTVLMIGQRRAGKSSVLSSMITRMEDICTETGFRFRADNDTKKLMNTKRAQLQNIFTVFRDQQFFSTMDGQYNGQEISMPTDADIHYRFLLGLTKRKEGKGERIIDFVDIRGEDLVDDMNDRLKDKLMASSVIMIAVDAPALMEGTQKDGYGEFHEATNLPEAIYHHFTAADTSLREKLKKGQKLPPKLVLFVPLKCEKYYYEKTMSQLNMRLKAGYRELLQFFKGKEEYTVAITPILTLGDVVFDHYETKTRADGKEIVIKNGTDGLDSMLGIPKFPMFRFRDIPPQFSPHYCEQPLIYLMMYISRVTATMGKGRRIMGKIATYFFFGLPGLAVKLAMEALLKDKDMLTAIQNVAKRLKTSGEGYELVYDRLGIGKGI